MGEASTTETATLDLDILWPRLEAVADEVAVTLIRTAFSHDVVECRDMAVAICDERGYLLAHSHLGATGHIGSVPGFMRHLLARYPDQDIAPGDVFACNDPWVAAGHTPDVFLASPVHHDGRLAAFVVTAVHHADIGGRAGAGDVQEIYEEGLLLPIIRLVEAHRPNEAVFAMLQRNVRFGDKVVGDFRAQVAAGDTGARRLGELLGQAGEATLGRIGDAIVERTEAAMREGIRELQPGTYHAQMPLDTPDAQGKRLELRLALTVSPEGVLHADFSGTSPQVPLPINCPIQYVLAYAVVAAKIVCASTLPTNEGAYRTITVSAPEGSLLNPTFPAPVFWRLATGLLVAELFLQCLRQAAPDRAPAESGSLPVWQFYVTGRRADGSSFSLHQHAFGGMGARPHRDGLPSVSFPYNVRDVSVEGSEQETPLLFLERSLVPDSGGAGRYRGGNGERVRIKILDDGSVDPAIPVVFSGGAGRLHDGARGVNGGRPGAPGAVLINGEPLPPDVLGGSPHVELKPRDELTLVLPGGGGYGPPSERPAAEWSDDLNAELVSPEGAAVWTTPNGVGTDVGKVTGHVRSLS